MAHRELAEPTSRAPGQGPLARAGSALTGAWREGALMLAAEGHQARRQTAACLRAYFTFNRCIRATASFKVCICLQKAKRTR